MNTTDPIPDDRLLTRIRAADALADAGFPISPTTLATLACRGNGPPFRRFGPRVLYPWQSTLEWARSRLGPLIANTSAPAARPTLVPRRINQAQPDASQSEKRKSDGVTRERMETGS
jgi:hypothetical protein